MECDLLTIIKQEKETLLNNNDLEVSYDVQVKEENDNFEDWCIRNGLSEYQENISYEELEEEEEYVYICTSCDEVFSDEISLYKHNLVHLKVPLYKNELYICDHCCYYSKNKSHLEKHILTKHKTNKGATKLLYECKICNRTFKYGSWWEHQNNVHSKQKFKCEVCNISFKCQRYLKRHNLYIHEGAKPSWRFHKVKREDIKSECSESEYVKCPKCPVNLNNKSALTTHMRNCHSKKKFQCKICMSILKCKAYLLTHMKRVHYDDGEVHSCDICDKIFKSPRYLKVHMKNTHRVKIGEIKKKFLI